MCTYKRVPGKSGYNSHTPILSCSCVGGVLSLLLPLAKQMRMFWGFMSLCTMPLSFRAFRALAETHTHGTHKSKIGTGVSEE